MNKKLLLPFKFRVIQLPQAIAPFLHEKNYAAYKKREKTQSFFPIIINNRKSIHLERMVTTKALARRQTVDPTLFPANLQVQQHYQDTSEP